MASSLIDSGVSSIAFMVFLRLFYVHRHIEYVSSHKDTILEINKNKKVVKGAWGSEGADFVDV